MIRHTAAHRSVGIRDDIIAPGCSIILFPLPRGFAYDQRLQSQYIGHGIPPSGLGGNKFGGAKRSIDPLVVGDRDESYVASAREMAGALPDATLHVLEGVGHFPNLECPELLATLLVAHAARCR